MALHLIYKVSRDRSADVVKETSLARRYSGFISFHFFLLNVKRRPLGFSMLSMGLLGEELAVDDDWLLRLEEADDELSDRERLSWSMSSRLTLFSWSKTSTSSSRISVNFDATMFY